MFKKTRKIPMEKTAVDLEIQKQLAEYNVKNSDEIDAMILWHLHEEFGFGKKRMKHFYNSFIDEMHKLMERYSLNDPELVWFCTRKLSEYGIDISEWKKEKMEALKMENSKDPRKNHEGYYDPTAFAAMKNLGEEERRFNKLLHTIFYLCDVAGFDIQNRIVLVDRKTGRVWK